MTVITAKCRDQHIHVRCHASAPSKRERLLLPSTPLRKPPVRLDSGRSLSLPRTFLRRRRRITRLSSMILVSEVRSFAASSLARASRSSRRSSVVFNVPNNTEICTTVKRRAIGHAASTSPRDWGANRAAADLGGRFSRASSCRYCLHSVIARPSQLHELMEAEVGLGFSRRRTLN